MKSCNILLHSRLVNAAIGKGVDLHIKAMPKIGNQVSNREERVLTPSALIDVQVVGSGHRGSPRGVLVDMNAMR